MSLKCLILGVSMKKCSKCGESKERSEFHRSSVHKDGLKPSCKVCRNAANKRHRENNPEYFQKWRDENKDRVKEYNAQYHDTNRNQANKRRLELAKKHPDREKARKHAWYLSNKDKVIARKRRRRDRKIAAGENYTSEHEKITLAAFGNKCFKCGNGDKLHVDHHRPLIKGHPLSLDNML